jgi:hypothetical protein
LADFVKQGTSARAALGEKTTNEILKLSTGDLTGDDKKKGAKPGKGAGRKKT